MIDNNICEKIFGKTIGDSADNIDNNGFDFNQSLNKIMPRSNLDNEKILELLR
jgi:hypothetical protein